MKKPMSAMTAHDMNQYKAALGMDSRTLAQALGKHPATVSNYLNGRYEIPLDVANKLTDLLKQEAQTLTGLAQQSQATVSVSNMIALQFEKRKRQGTEPHRTEHRFMNKQHTHGAKLLPPYRLSKRQGPCYIRALASWFGYVKQLKQRYADPVRQKDYDLELADIKALAASSPRSIPYDVVISVREWDVVSRALRHHSKTEPYAWSLYQTWRKNRGAGSYLNLRQKMIEARARGEVQPLKVPA